MFKFNKKLKSSEKKIVYDGGFKIKTSFYDDYRNSYLKICKASETLSKYFIESYDESASKLLFLIVLDKVDQIDYRQAEKIIMLKRENEFCKIDADNKASLRSLLKIISSYCGFEEIKKKTPLTVIKDTSIAGGVTNCVGSVCSFNEKLDGLFGQKMSQKAANLIQINSSYENNNGVNRSQMSNLNVSCDNEMNDSYCQLGECQSGLNKKYSKKPNMSDILVLNKNKSNILNNQISEINSYASNCSLNNKIADSVSDDIFLDESQPVKLNYVPLEMIETSNCVSKQTNNDAKLESKSDLNDKSNTSLSKFNNQDSLLNDYGRFDKLKTEALKSAFETNFNRLS